MNGSAKLHFTTKAGTSVMIAKPGDHIFVSGVVDSSIDSYANVDATTRGQQKVTFTEHAIFSVTGLYDNNLTCDCLHFARENRGPDAGRIYVGEQNIRFWPRLRAGVLELGLLKSVFATGGLQYVLTYWGEWLLANYGEGYTGNSGWILKKAQFSQILDVLNPEVRTSSLESDLLDTETDEEFAEMLELELTQPTTLEREFEIRRNQGFHSGSSVDLTEVIQETMENLSEADADRFNAIMNAGDIVQDSGLDCNPTQTDLETGEMFANYDMWPKPDLVVELGDRVDPNNSFNDFDPKEVKILLHNGDIHDGLLPTATNNPDIANLRPGGIAKVDLRSIVQATTQDESSTSKVTEEVIRITARRWNSGQFPNRTDWRPTYEVAEVRETKSDIPENFDQVLNDCGGEHHM